MIYIKNEWFPNIYSFYEVRNNYSKSYCLDIWKEKVATDSSLSSDTRQKLRAAAESAFSFDFRYVPVYGIEIAADFEWTETQTYKTFQKNIWGDVKDYTKYDVDTRQKQRRVQTAYVANGFPKECEATKFIGNEAMRFIPINLPSDLQRGIYNTNLNFIPESEIAKLAKQNAPEKNFGFFEKRSNIIHRTSVYFVPAVIISIKCNGQKHSAVVNQHNGGIRFFAPCAC